MNQFLKATFSFYGFDIEVKCQDKETLESIKRDYSFFIKSQVTPRLFFKVFNETPDYNGLPSLKASVYSPRNICYRQGNVAYIDYFGKALTAINYEKNSYTVYSQNFHLRHEIVFLSIMSLVNQYLDKKHLHRVHGLGLEVFNNALLLLLPSGGGKTTLLLEAIKNESIGLISEDSPLIDREGKAHPFPLRIGVTHDNKPQNIPDEQLHFIERMEAGAKYVIDIQYFKDKIVSRPVPVRYIFCGVRSLGTESQILPLSKSATMKEMIKNSVVGLGLYQGVEFVLQNGLIELVKKSGIALSRFINAVRAVTQSRTLLFIIGSDRGKNVETFLKFCRENINKK